MYYVNMNVLRSLIRKIRSGELNSFDISDHEFKAFKSWLTRAKITYDDGSVKYNFNNIRHTLDEIDNVFTVDCMSLRLGFWFNIYHSYQVAFVANSRPFQFVNWPDIVDYEVRDDDELPEDMNRNQVVIFGDYMSE